MIRHVVAWKLAAEEDNERAAHAQRIVAELEALVGVVPEIASLSAGANSLDIAGNWDVVLVADFADAEALDAYQVHPAHKNFAEFIGTVRSDRVAVDFEI